MAKDYELITVCDKCYCASCWQGLFMCPDAVRAGTIQITRRELRKKNEFEHPSFWKTDQELAVNPNIAFKSFR